MSAAVETRTSAIHEALPTGPAARRAWSPHGGGYWRCASAPAPPAMLRGRAGRARGLQAKSWPRAGSADKVARRRAPAATASARRAPIVVIQPEGIFYPHVRPTGRGRHRRGQRRSATASVEKLLYSDPADRRAHRATRHDDPLLQAADARRRCAERQASTPTRIDDYLARGGYEALAKALADDDARADHRRGQRLGPARPRRRRLPHRPQVAVRAAQRRASDKYVICNADEGDPGAFMDRSVLEGNPHAVIEGMIIAAFAIGAHEGYVYVRAEYPLRRRAPREPPWRRRASAACWATDVLGTRLGLRPAAQARAPAPSSAARRRR